MRAAGVSSGGQARTPDTVLARRDRSGEEVGNRPARPADHHVHPLHRVAEVVVGGARSTRGDQEVIKVQNADQIAGFKRGIRTSLDNLLRGYWKGDGEVA